jgi:hypothetical protein
VLGCPFPIEKTLTVVTDVSVYTDLIGTPRLRVLTEEIRYVGC